MADEEGSEAASCGVAARGGAEELKELQRRFLGAMSMVLEEDDGECPGATRPWSVEEREFYHEYGSEVTFMVNEFHISEPQRQSYMPYIL